MSELERLIADLALILICAGAMTLLFKRLKQPVVLGYIVAGFLASPNMPYMPSVNDLHVSLDLRGSYFVRSAHYRDFDDVTAKTFELRAGVTYKL